MLQNCFLEAGVDTKDSQLLQLLPADKKRDSKAACKEGVAEISEDPKHSNTHYITA